jgi:hypothetical protein
LCCTHSPQYEENELTDNSMSKRSRLRNTDTHAAGARCLSAQHEEDICLDEQFGPPDEPGSDERCLRIIDTAVPPTAAFAGSLTGNTAFSMALRALERLDAAPDGLVTLDLRAVIEADSSNLSSVAVWLLHHIAQQRGPMRLLLPFGEVGDAMLRRLPAKPNKIQQDQAHGCVVVDIGA